MLYEIPYIRQESHRLTKRWFTSPDMELFVWFKDSQLLSKTRKKTRHPALHDAEGEPSSLAQIARDFLAASECIDAGISDFIFARLMERPQLYVKFREASPRRLKAMIDAMRAGHRLGKHPAAT
jgi:hypothetical protein